MPEVLIQIPCNVAVFQNGMAMVFDQNGDQIPELQGRYHDVRAAIAARATPYTEIKVDCDWSKVRDAMQEQRLS